jgi:Domain of unknown function (DUF7007)
MLQRELIPEAIQTSDDIKALAGPLPTACVDETCDCPALPDNPKAGVQLTDGTYACWGCIEAGLLQMPTPWGDAISHTPYAEGIDFYETGGHGGFRVTINRIGEMHPSLGASRWFHVSEKPGVLGKMTGFDAFWFEEDCESYKVMLTWPDLFPDCDMQTAEATVKRWFPKEYKAWARSRDDVDAVRLAFKPGKGSNMTDLRESCQLSAKRTRDAVRTLADADEVEKVGRLWALKGEE